MVKLRISPGSTHFDWLIRRIVSLTSESEIEETFKKSEKLKRAFFGITREEGELKIEEN
jgi:hypothetical protein